MKFKVLAIICLLELGIIPTAVAQDRISNAAADLQLNREIIESSPVLQRWLVDPPNVLSDIYNTPSFSTKLHLGLTARDNSLGFDVGIEDIFLGRSPFTISSSYQQELNGRERSLDANLRYYILPLGSYFNLAPQVGYRYLDLFDQQAVSGLDLGLQGILVLSPHSADLRLSHTIAVPSTNQETSITTLSAGYAITKGLSLGSNIQWRRSPVRADSRVGFLLEWILR
jgi:hypothetical protein